MNELLSRAAWPSAESDADSRSHLYHDCQRAQADLGNWSVAICGYVRFPRPPVDVDGPVECNSCESVRGGYIPVCESCGL